MAEYIEREALIADIENRYCRPCEAEGKDYNHIRCRACWVDDMVGEIDEAPTIDAVPVVRCKDCKHGEPSNIRRGWRYCGLHITHHSGDNFCSYGERKEG